MNQPSRPRANSLRTSTLGIFPCIRFSWNSQINEGWSPGHLALRATGSRSGWWGVSQDTEAFLDQVITWRELGFNCCQMRKDYDQFESLPAWALKTLRLHARDETVPRLLS